MSHKLTIPLTIGLKGYFKFIRTCARTGEVRQETDWFSNLIVNTGKDALGGTASQTPSPFGGCVVGSGNTPPVAGNTLLESFVAGTGLILTTSRVENLSSAPFFIASRITYRFNEGVAAGNLSEVGIAIVNVGGTPGGGTTLFSRALIVDGGGVPTTITVLSDEFLDVIWEMRTYLPDDVVGSFDLDILGTPTSHSYTIRPGRVTNQSLWNLPGAGTGSSNSYRTFFADGSTAGGTNTNGSKVSAGTISAITDDITDTRLLMSVDGTRDAYVGGNYYVDLNFRYGLSFGNATPSITAIGFGCRAVYFQMSISPGVEKTATRIFDITLRLSWDNGP